MDGMTYYGSGSITLQGTTGMSTTVAIWPNWVQGPFGSLLNGTATYYGTERRLGEDGREVASYCIHPDEAIPAGDLALAKKLLLESDEAAFRRIANESPVGR